MMRFQKALLFGAVVAACVLLRPARVSTQRGRELFNGHDVMAGEVLVRLRDAGQLPAIRQLTDAVDDRPIGSGAWRRIRSNSRTVQALIQLLGARGDVEVEPNYILQAIGLPNDPSLASLWNLGGSPGIHATSAWNITTGKPATVVGVVDTGIDYTHPDLAANVWSAPTQFTVVVGGRSITCPAGSHGFNAIQFTCDPLDDHGHGTHVSGTIGAVGNNSIGVVGVNWTTSIMGLKFIDASGSGNNADAINAIDFAIQTKAFFAASVGANVRVLSNSYGGGGFATSFSDAIGRANTAGMLFAAAAGNNGTNNDTAPFYPASYTSPNLLAVAASDGTDAPAGFSNYGPKSVDLAAPGVSILSTLPSNTYGYLSGTSMATPHVSGAAALLLSACQLTTTQLVATLMNTVDPLPAFAGLTVSGGRLDVDTALRSCATFPTITLSSPTDGSTYSAPAQIALAANASDPNGISRVEFYDGTTLIATSTTSPYGGTWSNAAIGGHDVTAVAYDALGLSSVSADAHVTVTGSSGATATVTGYRTDTSTSGSWLGVYGSEGYQLANDATQSSSGVAVTVSGQSNYTWANSTTDGRALQRPSGVDRIAATWYSAATFSIDVNVTDGGTHTIALYCLDWENGQRGQQIDVLDATTGAPLDSRTVTGFGSGQYVMWNVTGHVALRVTRTAGVNAVVSGLFVGPVGSHNPPTSTATGYRTDTSTSGSWLGVYGSEAYQLANDATKASGSVAVTVSGQSNYTWTNSTSDGRALQRPSGVDRIAATWYSGTTFTIDVNVTDGGTHTIALYCLDWENAQRTQQVDVLDATTGALLDSRTVAGFASGQYVMWDVTGHVAVRVTRTGGVNAVVSGLFVDPVGSHKAPTSTATGYHTDTSTGGSWIEVYGSAAYQLANDATRNYSGVGVTVSGQSNYTWANSTTDARALQRPSGVDRIAATWYGATTFSIDVNVTDGGTHAIALYCLDWENAARAQQVDVLDAATGALLDSRAVTGFGNGQYVMWNVTGHVSVRVTRTSGVNAVVSGVFVD